MFSAFSERVARYKSQYALPEEQQVKTFTKVTSPLDSCEQT